MDDIYALDLVESLAREDLERGRRFNVKELIALAGEYIAWARAVEKRHHGLVYDYMRLCRMEAEIMERLTRGDLSLAERVRFEDDLEKVREAQKQVVERIRALKREVLYRNESYCTESDRIRAEAVESLTV
jgi:hypothetical protein